VYRPSLDSPQRLGYNCTLAVVSVMLGRVDSFTFHGRAAAANLRREELHKLHSFRSCWFFFGDATTIPAVAADHARRTGENVSAVLQSAASKSPTPACRLPRIGQWNVVQLPAEGRSSVLLSRVVKMLAHCAMTESSYLLYLDAKIQVPNPYAVWWLVAASMRPFRSFPARAYSLHRRANAPLPAKQAMRGSPAWVAPMHPRRQSLYDEVVCTYLLGKVGEQAFRAVSLYAAKGFPADDYFEGGPGLIEGEWHLRDMRSTNSTSIAFAWFRQFLRWQHAHERDQLSFNYVVWRLGLLPSQTQPLPTRPKKSSNPAYHAVGLRYVADARMTSHLYGSNKSRYNVFAKSLIFTNFTREVVRHSSLAHDRDGRVLASGKVCPSAGDRLLSPTTGRPADVSNATDLLDAARARRGTKMQSPREKEWAL